MLEAFAFNPRTVFVYEFTYQSAHTYDDDKHGHIYNKTIDTGMRAVEAGNVSCDVPLIKIWLANSSNWDPEKPLAAQIPNVIAM